MFGRCATDRKRAVINILGRVGELDEAERSLRAVREGSGASLVILGAAGMGKTTFLAELRRKAEDDGFRVRHARGELLERGFPWGVVRRLFERAGGKRTGAAELARIPLQGSEVDGSLFASLHGLYWLAVELAQEQPLALFVDDAHWADMLSMRWLAYLAARIGEDPVLLAIAARPEPCEDDEGAWPSLMSNGHVRELAPLGYAAAASLVEEVLGEAPDPAFAALCRRLTAGNPLLLVELARGIERARIPPDASGVQMLQETPRTVLTPTVALRLRRLGRESLGVARAIAVLGSHATPLLIARLSELDAAATSIGLERLAGDRLIRVEPSIEFVHPLVRAAAYEDLKPPARGAWHARAARLLSSDPVDPDVIAGHLLLADPSGDQSFVPLLRAAARRAQARAAPRTAAEYLSRALAEPSSEADRAAVFLERGYAELANRPQRAVEDFQEALSRGNCTAEQIDARIGLAHALIRGAGFADAVDVLEEGLRTLGEGEPALLKDALLAALLNTARWDIAGAASMSAIRRGAPGPPHGRGTVDAGAARESRPSSCLLPAGIAMARCSTPMLPLSMPMSRRPTTQCGYRWWPRL